MRLLKRKNMYVVGLIICGATTVSGCAQLKELAAKTSELFTGNKQVPIVYTKAPNDTHMMDAKVKNITFGTFAGDSSNSQFTAKVIANVAGLKGASSSCYTIIAPEKLPTQLVGNDDWENNLLSMPSDSRAALLNTVDTVMVGTVTLPKTTQQSVQRERENTKKCVTYNMEKKTCSEYEKYYISCTSKTANLEFTAKAINIDSAQVIFSKSYTGTSTTEHCPDSKAAGVNNFQLESTAVSNAFKQLDEDIAPHRTAESPRIRTSDSSKLEDTPDAYEIFKQARAYVGDKRFGVACDTYQKAATMFDASPSLNFNLGICMERIGDYKSAASYYEKADQLYQELEKESDEEIVKRLNIAANMEKETLLVAKACQ